MNAGLLGLVEEELLEFLLVAVAQSAEVDVVERALRAAEIHCSDDLFVWFR